MQIPDWLSKILAGILPFIQADSTGGVAAGAEVNISFGGIPANTPTAQVAAQGWSKSLADCRQEIRRAFPLVEAEFCAAHPDCSLRVDYTWRSPALQLELYKKGRSLVDGKWVVTDKAAVVTDKDGSTPSYHNVYPSAAADIYIVQNGGILWDDSNGLYTEIGHMWEKHGLVSGATWKYDWKDVDHVQTATLKA